jgi:hypothetical protein
VVHLSDLAVLRGHHHALAWHTGPGFQAAHHNHLSASRLAAFIIQ